MRNETSAAPSRVTLAAFALLGLTMAGAAYGADGARPPAKPPSKAWAEVQINLCGEPGEIAKALAMRADSRRREVWYFDTRTLALFDRGAVFRLRVGDGPAELTLKAARQDCATLPPALLLRGEGKCEYDLHGDALHGAVSLSRPLPADETVSLLAGRTTLAATLGEAQIRFLRELLKVWPLPEGVTPIGPVTLDGYRSAQGRHVLEAWNLPSGAVFVEISQKARVANASRVHDELLARLDRAGVSLCTDQSSRADDKLRLLTR
jgi:hypothetical protein